MVNCLAVTYICRLSDLRLLKDVICITFKLSYFEGLNGVNRLATNGEKYNWLPTKREKKYRLPTGKILIDNRHGPTLWGCFYSEINRIFYFSFLSNVCVKVNHLKSPFQLTSIKLLENLVRFPRFPGMYRGLPISSQQVKLIWDCSNGAPSFPLIFGENPGKRALTFRETDFSHWK